MAIEKLIHQTRQGMELVCSVITEDNNVSIQFSDRDLENHFRLNGIHIAQPLQELPDRKWVPFPENNDRVAVELFILAFKSVELTKPSYASYHWIKS